MLHENYKIVQSLHSKGEEEKAQAKEAEADFSKMMEVDEEVVNAFKEIKSKPLLISLFS